MTHHEIAHTVAQEVWGSTDHTALVKYAETITPAEWLAAVTRIIELAKEMPNVELTGAERPVERRVGGDEA